jgi:hypothetical protein
MSKRRSCEGGQHLQTVEIEQTYWSRNKPVDVSNVEDLTVKARDFGIGPHELDRDGSVAQVGSHGEVSDGCDESDGSSDVVEESVLARDCKAPAHEGDG